MKYVNSTNSVKPTHVKKMLISIYRFAATTDSKVTLMQQIFQNIGISHAKLRYNFKPEQIIKSV